MLKVHSCKLLDELGVRPVINAGGTKTAYGGTRLHPHVLEAMAEATNYFVSIAELNQKVGEYIGTVTGAEAGMVTGGAASGMVLSIAACMTGTDIAKVRQLPNARAMKDELVIQKIHRGSYSHTYTFAGAKFVEVGDFNECLAEELGHAINEQTAAVAYLLGPRVSRAGLTLHQVCDIAHRRNVPVIVDAADMLPPKSNLRRFIREGADLVAFSGGKLINAPQSTGLLFGRKDLIEAALANFGPNHSIGRPHKVSKEDMTGLYVALKLFVDSDEEEMLTTFRKRLVPVIDALAGIDGITVEMIHDGHNYQVPVAVIQFSESWRGPGPTEITKHLLNSDPRIFMRYFQELGHLVVNPICLRDDEAEVVAAALKRDLSAWHHGSTATATAGAGA